VGRDPKAACSAAGADLWSATDVRLIDLFRKQVPASADEVGLEPATAGVPRTGGSDAVVARLAFRSDVQVRA
jgi:hypothetical protein